MTGVELLDLIGRYAGVAVTTLVASGVGAYIGAYLKKKGENLATHEDIDKLVTQVSAVTVATKNIEDRISRASRVYERELEILSRLYRHFSDAQALIQSMTRAGRMANEISPEEYARLLAKSMDDARDEFLNGRLFMPVSLVRLCETFSSAVSEGQRGFAWSLHPGFDPAKRTEFWKAATSVAYTDLPRLLEQIDAAARVEIGAAGYLAGDNGKIGG